MSEYMYPGYIKTDDIVKYCEEMARDYELTNPSYSDACSDIANKCLDLSNRDIAEVKYGKWIGEYYTCSECGEDLSTGIMEGDSCFVRGFNGCNFCPNCGADMRGEENAKNKSR